MSVRCPRCEGVIPEKIFKEIQEWGPEAMRCHYCDCPLNKNIFEQRRWDRLFPVDEKIDESIPQLLARKSKAVVQQVGKSANDFKKEYFG
jgi:hypothetical protein